MSEFRWPVRVYYEDTDCGGVVYYANYLKFMERARTERLRLLGFEQADLRTDQHVLFTVHSIDANFVRPAVYDDQLEVTANIMECKRASLVFSQQIYREGDKKPLCKGTARIACVDSTTFRPCPIPEIMLREINHAS
ncbi:MAG: tol-pal system-associated acyl-CoA thioesterase [Gammaproteobacteria bacterium]